MDDKSLGRLVVDMWDLRAAMQADGVSGVALNAGIEAVLRERWPFVREWKYICDSCHDYGLIMAQCVGDRTCGRFKPHAPHEFGRACWCQAGAKFKGPLPPGPDAFQKAAKSKPMKRLGR